MKLWQSILLYALAFILIIIGIFCATALYQEMTAESYVNGSIDLTGKYSVDTFSHSTTSIIFYDNLDDETDERYYEQEFLKVKDFDGNKKQYQVTLNDYILIADINYGSISTNFETDFYDIDGNKVCDANLEIFVKFLNNKTTLTLKTSTYEESKFFEQYFSDYGFRFNVDEIVQKG